MQKIRGAHKARLQPAAAGNHHIRKGIRRLCGIFGQVEMHRQDMLGLGTVIGKGSAEGFHYIPV